jgi:DNA transformation protein
VPVSDSFREFVLEQLNRAMPPVRAKRMFGGVGLYAGDVFFAIIADDTVYFKTDASTQPAYDARGMRAFRPYGDERASMKYFELPEDVLESPETLLTWAEQAVSAASQKKKRSVRRRGV